MRNYLHYSWYYFLALLESIPNFLCSLMGIYPKFDFSTNFLVGQTISRVGSIISDRDMDRMSKIPKNKKAKLSKIRQKHPDQYDEDFGESFEKFRKKRW